MIATAPPSPGSVGNGMHSSVRALIMVISLFFAWGFIIVLNGPLIAKLKGLFSLNYTEAMLTRFVFFLGYFIFSAPASKAFSQPWRMWEVWFSR